MAQPVDSVRLALKLSDCAIKKRKPVKLSPPKIYLICINISRSVMIFRVMENNSQPQVSTSIPPNTTNLPPTKLSSFPSKSFLLFLVLLFLTATSYFYLQTQSLKKQVARLNSLPSPSPTYIYTTAPSPTPTPISHTINTSRQSVDLVMPKYLDTPQEKETYRISFDKVGTTPKYHMTSDMFPKLVIEGDKYQFTLQIPKEGQSNTFVKIPVTSEIESNQFSKVTRITNPLSYMETNNVQYEGNKSYYTYTTDYSTNCTQWTPIPPACSSLQVYYNDQLALANQVGVYASCVSYDQSPSSCDKIISTLNISQDLRNQF
ncbi:MAG: hypothetical protein UY21_C0025G0012 [Microgenomates group bacterium GW2011_GWA1_48_10]|nr:MAG: hypothetical protein UY21_C0025G0012 [Microgenomates group bacterium GW2011_GWA1_48_10]